MPIYPRDKAEQIQDHPDIVAALDELGVRMDLNEEGWVWRAILYDRMGDDALAHLRELPELQEVWTVGSRVSKAAVQALQDEFPELHIRN